MWYGREGVISKKEIKRTQYNLKGRDVLPVYRIYVDSGVASAINSM